MLLIITVHGHAIGLGSLDQLSHHLPIHCPASWSCHSSIDVKFVEPITNDAGRRQRFSQYTAIDR